MQAAETDNIEACTPERRDPQNHHPRPRRCAPDLVEAHPLGLVRDGNRGRPQGHGAFASQRPGGDAAGASLPASTAAELNVSADT